VDYECLVFWQSPKFSSIIIAVVIVGPYRAVSMYGRKLSDWMQKALSLAWIYHTVILLVPDKQHARAYRSWLTAFAPTPKNPADRHPNIIILEINPDPDA
jgi:hypothetical protein